MSKRGFARKHGMLTGFGRLGDDELLEADYTRYVLLQGGELQGGEEAAFKLHDRIHGSKKLSP